MSNRVEKLRVYLLGSAILLMLVIAVFIGMARYLRRHSVAMLPVQLALNILRETENPTICPFNGGKKEFCIHAAKSIEYSDGKIKLHDVLITLYGKNGDRNDHIYGDEFEYDKNAQIVRATGIVHIDLQAAGVGEGSAQAASAKVMHVTTSGLVYLQKLGLASTSEPIEFEVGGMNGHAVGADYSSDSALIALHSAVSMSGIEDGHALTMTAATAQFDDQSQQAFLTRATYESEGRKAAAEQATLYRRVDGTLSRIDAKGNVTVQAKGSTAVAQHADVALTATSQPRTAVLTGGVKYSSEVPLREVNGQADEAIINFDAEAKPLPEHAVFVGAVHVTARTRATLAAKEPWSTRELKAAQVEVELTPTASGKAQVRDITATGNPRVNLVNNGTLASSKGAGTTEMSANTLTAHLIAMGDGKTPQVDTIEGRGNTLLRQLTAAGEEQSVAADSLDAKLRPQVKVSRPKGGAAGGVGGDKVSDTLLSAVQVGHVQMMQRKPAKSGAGSAPDEVEHALADRAAYDGDTDQMTLSGGVQWSDASSILWANQVTFDHATGDAHAAGSVKVSYTADEAATSGGKQGEAAHVLADRADMDHVTDTSTFYGKPVRVWRGGNQILAPVISLSNTQKRLVARGDGTAAGVSGMQVTTLLAESGSEDGSAKTAAGAVSGGCEATAKTGMVGMGAAAQTAGAVRVVSGGLTYAANTGQADFTGGFRATTVDGTIRATEGVAYMQQVAALPVADPAKAKRGVPVASISGELDHIVAMGRVELEKPGLKATGERLVYTASDRSAVLTGDDRNPPKAVEVRGTTTGSELRFRSSCDGSGGGSVEVLGAPGQRVHTDARVSDTGKKEKGKR